MDFTQHYHSPLGAITLASDGSALTGLWFDRQKYDAQGLSEMHEERAVPVLEETKDWLNCYFGGGVPDYTPKLSMRTTAFRKAVWEILLKIPYGETMTYGEIARILAKKTGVSQMSAQAVGSAVGHNAISLIIPCHRVIGSDGSLTGYAGGIERKRKLLMLENGNRPDLFLSDSRLRK